MGNVIWDAATGSQLFEHNGMMNGPAEWFPNGERLAASGADGVVRVINASDGETLLPERESSRLFNLLMDVVGRQPQNTWPQPGHLQVQLFSNTTDTIAYVRTQGSHLTIFGTHRSRLPSSGIDHEQKYAYSMDLKWPVKEFQLAENGSKLVAFVSNRLEVWRVGAGGPGPQFILQEFTEFDALQPDGHISN